ncbi:hypothetical protein LOC71_12045 [Rhodopirellula sp. JC740]|uniref:Uncharacterized protein n=1 Tax=Rhodopirellula halodulae TaxID=2894198 RepID=A0ABS8NHK7_9BACT|nr:hypothetical protein [Rhodopirellula sp. JC740]MCC9643011.1 hypothetical protein [Rhodopirellula sp. JC740]
MQLRFETGASSESAPQSDSAFDCVEIDGDTVRLNNVLITDNDLARHLEPLSAEERITELTSIIEVGLFCVTRAAARTDMDFVRTQAERILAIVGTQLGGLPTTVRDNILSKLGTSDGQVLKPVKDQVDHVHRTLTGQVDTLTKLINEVLDPTKDSTSLGRAIKKIDGKLDPNQKDSIQSAVTAAVLSVTGTDGGLAKSVKTTVSDAIKPLKEQVDGLAKEVRGQQAAEEALSQTTQKGRPYEEQVVNDLNFWAAAVGAELIDAGPDCRPGDVVIKLGASSVAGTDVRIVIEARDRQTRQGRKQIADQLETKMHERDCNAAIYLSKTPEGLAKEIGTFAEGECARGPWVATTHDFLHQAVRLLICLVRLRAVKSDVPEFDGAMIEKQIDRVRTALTKIRTVNTSCNQIRDHADKIRNEADSLKSEIRESLVSIEEALRKAS